MEAPLPATASTCEARDFTPDKLVKTTPASVRPDPWHETQYLPMKPCPNVVYVSAPPSAQDPPPPAVEPHPELAPARPATHRTRRTEMRRTTLVS